MYLWNYNAHEMKTTLFRSKIDLVHFRDTRINNSIKILIDAWVYYRVVPRDAMTLWVISELQQLTFYEKQKSWVGHVEYELIKEAKFTLAWWCRCILVVFSPKSFPTPPTAVWGEGQNKLSSSTWLPRASPYLRPLTGYLRLCLALWCPAHGGRG